MSVTAAHVPDRIPPSSIEAERALLGSMMQGASYLEMAEDIVGSDDFYAPQHAFFARVIFELHAAGKPVDLISLAESVRAHVNFDKFGGFAYLQGLTNNVLATEQNVEYYARLVAEKAQLRRLIAAGLKIADIGFLGEDDADEALESAEKAMDAATNARRALTGGITMRTAMVDLYDDITRAHSGENALRAITTPWKTVNAMTGGFFPGELVAVASAPGQGKTAAVLSLADYVAMTAGLVVFFSLEMTVRALSRRMLALHSNVSAKKQRLGDVREDQWERISLAMSVITRRPLLMYGRETGTLALIRRELRALKRQRPVRAVIIDHAGFIADVDAGVKVSKHERLDAVYRRLLAIAEEIETTMFCVQHVNRLGMGQRPTLANIRDGGNIEGHAHAVIFPYRANPVSDDPRERCQGEFIIAKCRDGEEGPVPAFFHGWRNMWTENESDPLWFDELGQPAWSDLSDDGETHTTEMYDRERGAIDA